MLESKNWIVPYFNYEVRYDKPVLFYYLEAFSLKVFGINEFASRLPSVLTALICVFFVYYFIKTFYNALTGLISVLILMTSLEFAALSRFSITDMTLASFLSCSVISFFLGYNNLVSSHRFFTRQISVFTFWYIVAFIFLSFAFLTKGPVAVILVFLVLFPFFWWIGKLDYFFKSNSFRYGFLLFILITFPWFYMADIQTKGEFTRIFFGLHNFTRYVNIVSGHKGSVFYFVPVILIGFLPWFFFLPQAVSSLIKRGLRILQLSPKMQIEWFCLWWFLVIFIFFSFAKTQLLTYVLPAFIPLAIIIALYFEGLFMNGLETKLFSYGLGIFFLVCLTCLYIYLFNLQGVFPKLIKELEISMEILFYLFILLAGFGMAWASSKSNVPLTICIMLSTLFIFYFSFITFLLPKVDKYSQTKLRTFAKSIPKNVEIATYKIMKPSLVFYSARKIKKFENLEKLQVRLNMQERFALVTQKKFLGNTMLENAYLWDSDSRYLFYTNYNSKVKKF